MESIKLKNKKYWDASGVFDHQELKTQEELNSGFTEDISDLKSALGATGASDNLLDVSLFADGYYSSGVWRESDQYITSDFIDLGNAENVYIHRFNLNNGQLQDTSRYFQYLYWFDANETYLDRSSFVSGTTTYAVPSGSEYVRVMGGKTSITSDLSANKGFYVGVENTTAWIPYDEGQIPNYKEITDALQSAIPSATISLTDGIYTVETNHASYKFQRITNASKNVDTYRLYEGNLKKNNSLFNMWVNSDAEGAVKIAGETDYVSGYHGSEIMTSFKAFLDGVDITALTSINATGFNTLAFYVESNVYHCYQDEAVADQIAFKRAKVIEFAGNKVTISNSYVAQDTVTLSSARLALFQCYKSDGNTPIFTDFSVNTDFKNYPVSTIDTNSPAPSADMTEAILNTTLANIHFRSVLTNGQSYRGSVENFSSQNRLKFYFDSISTNTAMAVGDSIRAQFEFAIK